MRTSTNPLAFAIILLIGAIVVFAGLNPQASVTGESARRAATAGTGTSVSALCPAINATMGSVITSQAGATSAHTGKTRG